ncbi:MAG: MotA/TolQ/ExbB proton channel family protein [Alphaproteobacteria bacterium]|nr:MotA/TolQ/ExbB proton channel family protein [Alphaproteobacteria bacterium]
MAEPSDVTPLETGRQVSGNATLVPPGSRIIVDMATILGLIIAFGMIGTAITLTGAAGSFLDPPSILIVIGGTFAVTAVAFSTREVLASFGVIGPTLFRVARDPREAATWMLYLSEIARAKGLLSLDNTLSQMRQEPFLQNGIRQVVDGSSPEEVEEVMSRELSTILAKQERSASILRKAAETAPAMGLIGTLIGLIQMLSNLEDPTSIGPAMALALLTTFYGAILAYMVFSPLASKLERNQQDEELVGRVYTIGTLSIARQENPRRLENTLNAVLPPEKRVSFFN